MYLIRLSLAAQALKADREILGALRRDTRHDAFRIELERRLLGQ